MATETGPTAMTSAVRNAVVDGEVLPGQARPARPESVAKAIERAITSRRPRSRYVVTPAARTLITLRAVTPGRAWDRLVASMFGM